MNRVLISSLLCSIYILISTAVASTNEYRAPLTQDIKTLDPIYIDDNSSYEVSSQLYNGLVGYRVKINNERESFYDIVPDLAEYWTVSSDMCSYTFKLKDNVRFHNEKILDSIDVKKSLERVFNPKNNSKGLWTVKYLPIVGMEKFQKECLSNHPLPDLRGIQIVDTNLIRINLTKPSPYILQILALPYFYIPCVAEINLYKDKYTSKACGTGPFKLVEINKGKSIKLIKNNYYFESQLPYFTTLYFNIYPSSEIAFKNFLDNNLEHTFLPKKYFYEIVNSYKWNKVGQTILEKDTFVNPKYSFLLKKPLNSIRYISMDNRVYPFNNVKLRQALNYAINKVKLAEEVLDYQVIPFKSLSLIKASFNKFPYTYDPLKAKKLLYEAGWKDFDNDGYIEPSLKLKYLTLYFPNDENITKVCEAIKEDLNNVGIKVNLKAIPTSVYITNLTSKKLSFAYTSWKPEFSDISRSIYPLFYTGLKTNFSNFSNKTVDSLLNYAESITNEDERIKIYFRIEKVIFEQAPIIFLSHPVEYKLIQPNVINQQIHPVLPNIFKLVRLE